ncbi:hypothetical protein [Peristeroidobacter agariperforans]|uniref:hypothetical protein n=1 Tax=Peristeroidobacter agariperforans TaxID=268404 RepID=UPI0018E5443F|nr:hypothetical protein [Peristeroidobacter agariperforans]
MAFSAADFPVQYRTQDTLPAANTASTDPYVRVSQWAAAVPTTQDPTAPFHDCLWRIATEQAVLERMKTTGENFPTALRHVQQNPKEIIKQLDIVCDDNGFRRIDGTGPGTSNPHVINTGAEIKVRIDPSTLYKQAPAVVDGQPSGTAYNAAVGGDQGGVNLAKKAQLDAWLATIPGFATMSEPLKAAVITAYSAGADPNKLVTMLGSAQFNNRLRPQEQIQLLALFTRASQGPKHPQMGPSTSYDLLGVIDGLLQQPIENDAAAAQLKLMSTLGFAQLNAGQQQALLNRYQSDYNFRVVIDKVVGDPKYNFSSLGAAQQAHVLDVMRSFTREFFCKGTGEDYTPLSFVAEGQPGPDPIPYDQQILMHLYQRVLTNPAYKLNEVTGTQQSAEQSGFVLKFINENWPGIKMNWTLK